MCISIINTKKVPQVSAASDSGKAEIMIVQPTQLTSSTNQASGRASGSPTGEERGDAKRREHNTNQS
jgi:hypothetical protein